MFTAEGTDGLAESAGEVEGGEADAVEGASRVARAGAAGVVTQNGVEHIALQRTFREFRRVL